MRNLDAAYLGRFLGLAEASGELRGKQTDAHFVDSLIEIANEYRAEEAAQLRDQLRRGDTITNLETIVTERMSS